MENSENETKAWCSTLVDDSGVHIPNQGNWGYCEPSCQIDELTEDKYLAIQEESKRTHEPEGKGSIIISILVPTVSLIMLGIIFFLWLRKKRNLKEIGKLLRFDGNILEV